MKAKPRPLTKASLERAALRYIERYAPSGMQLRRYLDRRVKRAAEAGEEVDREWVQAVAERCAEWGYVDDARLARQKLDALRARGASRTKIRAELERRGIDRGLVDEHLAGERAEQELEAARSFARRKRLGAWRKQPLDELRRRKELATFGRAGFEYAVAKRVVDEPAPSSGSADV